MGLRTLVLAMLVASAVQAGPVSPIDIVLHAAMARARTTPITPGDHTLVGHVVDHKHRAIAGATVTLDDRRTTTSAADGSFAFDA
jgi:hypothetical protein